jgi:sugar phosphate isomerase/epimerase
MVEFGSGYYMPMDRDYGLAQGNSSQAKKATGDIGVGIGEIGMSIGLGPVPNVQAISAKLKPGSKKMEFSFTGMGKSSGQGQTPGMYGQKQRQALVEMSKANRVDFTTHASVGIYGLSGMDQQGNFSKASKANSIQELKRAIDFAADVGFGGPVVVHTGEFNRPVMDASWNQEGDYKNKFEMFPGEGEQTSFRVVDTRTGAVISEAKKNRKVSRPVWKRYEDGDDYWSEKNGERYTDDKGNKVKKGDYIDYFGNKMDPAERVPIYNEETGTFVTEQLDWGDMEKEADEMTDRAQKAFNNWESMPEEDKTKSIWRERIEKAKKAGLNSDDIKVRADEAYIISTLETNAAHSRGWAYSYGSGFKEQVEQIKKLKKAKVFYEKLREATSEEEKWKLKKQVPGGVLDLIPPDEKFPDEIIKDQLLQAQSRIKQAQEASASQWAQAEESMETIRHVESAESYAIREACDAYAQAAMSAMRQTQVLEEKGQLKRPIQVAMENLFPEVYGAHPDELITLVEGSREKMTQMLKQQGVSENEAERRAKEHITATFDTGHLNMWRKYWKGDDQKSLKDNDEDFNKWLVDKVDQMSKRGVIGHVHLVDNYGYHDDHLAPGEGNTPIRAMIKTLKKNGYKGDLIVEPGADYTTDVSGFHSVMKTWRHLDLPVYGTGTGVSAQNWGQVGYGFFGQNQPAYFVFNPYTPSEDWTLWSGVQLE